MMKILKDFIQFVKRPTEFFSEKLSSREKWKMVVTLLLFEFLFLFAVVYPIELLIDKYIITTKESLHDWGVVVTVFGMIIFAPLIEEIIFRLPLRYERNYIFQMLDAITGNRIEKMWKKYYPFFFYAFAIAFGFFHIFNYENTETLFYWISPLIILSQLSGGVLLGYIRLKAGISWGMLYHALFNGILFFVNFLFFHNVETVSDSYITVPKFTVHELLFIDKEEQCYEISKTPSGDFMTLHFNDMSFNTVMKTLGIDKKLKGSDIWIDLEVESLEGISKEKVLEILEREYAFEDKKIDEK